MDVDAVGDQSGERTDHRPGPRRRRPVRDCRVWLMALNRCVTMLAPASAAADAASNPASEWPMLTITRPQRAARSASGSRSRLRRWSAGSATGCRAAISAARSASSIGRIRAGSCAPLRAMRQMRPFEVEAEEARDARLGSRDARGDGLGGHLARVGDERRQQRRGAELGIGARRWCGCRRASALR